MRDFLQLIADYGWGAAIIILALVVVVQSLFSKSSSTLKNMILVDSGGVNHPTGPASMTTETFIDARYHPFFSATQYKISVEIPEIRLAPDKPVKQQMFRDVLLIYTRRMHDTCMDIATMDSADYSSDKWVTEVNKRITKMLLGFQRECLENGVPEVALYKFSKWNARTVSLVQEYVKILGSSQLYSNNNTRTNTFLMIIGLLLVTNIADAEKTLKELNGEIGGKMYKGSVIEH